MIGQFLKPFLKNIAKNTPPSFSSNISFDVVENYFYYRTSECQLTIRVRLLHVFLDCQTIMFS